MQFKKIISMKKVGKKRTYDLQVENTHNFLLKSGLLSHNSEDYLLMFKTTSFRDKAEMCDELRREKKMKPAQIADLGSLEKGEAYIAETGKVVKKIKITLPRSAYWKKENGNFYKNVWPKHCDEWKNVQDITEEIAKAMKVNEEKYKKKKPVKKEDEFFEEVNIKKQQTEIIKKEVEIPVPMKPIINYREYM